MRWYFACLSAVFTGWGWHHWGSCFEHLSWPSAFANSMIPNVCASGSRCTHLLHVYGTVLETVFSNRVCFMYMELCWKPCFCLSFSLKFSADACACVCGAFLRLDLVFQIALPGQVRGMRAISHRILSSKSYWFCVPYVLALVPSMLFLFVCFLLVVAQIFTPLVLTHDSRTHGSTVCCFLRR